MKDYREHAIATLFGQIMVRLFRFRCAACGTIEVGIDWPSHCRSTPELDQLQAHLSALMTYRTAADVLEQMFPVGVGKDKETMRRHTLRAGAALLDCATMRPETSALAISVTLDPPSSGVARTENVTWWYELAMSKQRPAGLRFRSRSQIQHGHQNVRGHRTP